MIDLKKYDDPFYAKLHHAEECGLTREWALNVAYGFCTLEEALGDMDMNQESAVVGCDLGADCDCGYDLACTNCFPF